MTRKYTFEFADPSLEDSIDKYVKKKHGEEVYVCLFGKHEATKARSNFVIKHLLPLPNCAESQRNLFCLPPEYLDAMVIETESFTGLRFLGFLHNHPKTKSLISRADIAYAGRMKIDWGMDISAIVGERKTMRVYHVEMSSDDKTYSVDPIEGKTFKYKVLTRRY